MQGNPLISPWRNYRLSHLTSHFDHFEVDLPKSLTTRHATLNYLPKNPKLIAPPISHHSVFPEAPITDPTPSLQSIIVPRNLPNVDSKTNQPSSLVVEAHSSTFPMSVKVALSNPRWAAAMENELTTLRHNHTWVLVEQTPNIHIVGCRSVLCIKERANGSLERYKARLVAKG